ncbi:MAG: 50S ribosomal protein L29 [marine bacterium B5-7]|nr:MAG: 50S ribosomal protein L29 [marine bacterium B5-7]
MNALNEYRQMDGKKLQETLASLLKEQFNLRMQKGTGQLAKPHLLRQVRRNIARVKTLLRGEKA